MSVKIITAKEKLMQYVFDLAANGEGYVEPNPLVGALILKNGQLLSVGYHKCFGGLHAEIEAINKIHREKLKDSELFINLEPCCHTNKKNPPCLDTILSIKFKRIYISNIDTNMEVNGKSIQILKDKGYKVKIGILEEEGKWLNRVFFKSINKKIPYIVLKIATTSDGKIGLKNKRILISSPDAIEYAKQERDKFNAILVGANTIDVDNPILLPSVKKLDVRKTFYRIILSTKSIKSLINKKIFKTASEDYPIIYVTTYDNNLSLLLKRKSTLSAVSYLNHIYILYFKLKRIIITQLLKILYKKFNIGKLLIEGGATTFRQFFDARLYDEIHLYQSSRVLNDKDEIKLFKDNFVHKFFNLKPYKIEKISTTTLYKFFKGNL